MIGLSGATHTTVPLLAPDFEPDLAALETAMNSRTKIIVVNNPHNPMGSMFSRQTLCRIVELAQLHDAIIVTDEVYEHLTFGQTHIPVATLPAAAGRTLTISSAGKTFSVTGWKIGWLSGPAHLVAMVRSVKSFLTYSSGTPFQVAVASALALPGTFYTDAASTLRSKRDLLIEGLTAAGFAVNTPEATYFVTVDTAPLGVTNALELARELPTLLGVAAIPVSVFCHDDGAERTRSLLRFAFCKKTSVLEEACARLATLAQRL